MTNADRTAVRYERGAIHVSDADPVELALINNARDVIGHAVALLGGKPTVQEATFTATELARCLRDMLELVDPRDN